MTGTPRLPALVGRLAVGAALLLPAASGAAELRASLEPGTVTVGDRVEVVLVLTAPRQELSGAPRFPIWDDRWGDAEIVEAEGVERLESRAGESLRYRQRLVLAAFRTGTVELPPKGVTVPGPNETAEVWTPAGLDFEVESVLPGGADVDELEPKPPEPPGGLPLGRAFWWTLAVTGSLAAALLLRLPRKDREERGAGRPRSAGEELDSALTAAAQAVTVEEGHVVLSLGLRRFLGRRFGFPAAESTTGEIRRQLRGRRCPPAVEGRVHEVLLACDRVKFARAPATRGALDARLEAAREIAGAVEDHLRPPEPRREVAA